MLLTAWGMVAARDLGDAGSAYQSTYVGWLRQFSLPELIQVWSVNLLGVPTELGIIMVQPVLTWIADDARPLTCFGAGLGTLVFCAGILIRRGGVLLFALTAYFGAVILWPWPSSLRFLVPVAPLMLAIAFGSLWSCRIFNSRRVFPVFAASVALVNAIGAVRASAVHVKHDEMAAVAYQTVTGPVLWRDFIDVFAWIRVNTPTDAVTTCLLEGAMFLYAERQVWPVHGQDTVGLHYSDPPRFPSAEALVANWRAHGVTHVVRLPTLTFAEYPILESRIDELKRQNDLRSLYVGRDDRFEVLHLSSVRSQDTP